MYQRKKPQGFDERLQHSIDLLKKAEKLALMYDLEDGFYLAFSAGKDSQALYHVAQMAGVRFKAHINWTSVDPPQVIRFIDWNCENKEWLTGFMAGIYDAEGGKDMAKRMYNSEQQIIDTFIKALELYGFKYTFDKPITKRGGKTVQSVRLLGGLAESIRFVSICNPAITSKFDFTGCRLKNYGDEIHVVSIQKISELRRLIDIETSTGNFLANGIVAHNCYLKRGAPSKVLGSTEVKLKKCFKDEDHAFNTFRREVSIHLDTLRQTGIFFSFTTDPMIPETITLTMWALEYCIANGIPAKTLTKNAMCVEAPGMGNLFHKIKDANADIRFGFTLTGRDDMEPNASTNAARIEAMAKLKEYGIKTWASIEPVIDWPNSRLMVEITLDCCDHYKIGLRSGVKRDYYDNSETINSIQWLKHIILNAGKTVYFKESIRKRVGEIMGDKWLQSFLNGTLDMDGSLIYL